MRKLIQMLVIACMVVLGTQVAFANYDKETVIEGADLTSIHRIAVGAPGYQQIAKEAPNKDMLTKIIYDAGHATRCYVLSYDMVADDIRATTGVDVSALESRQAAKVFKENVASIADAYVIVTVANNSRTAFFFDLYKTGTNELLYSYGIWANRAEGDSVKSYTNYCEQFYKHFERAVEKQSKGEGKKRK